MSMFQAMDQINIPLYCTTPCNFMLSHNFEGYHNCINWVSKSTEE